MWFEQAVVYQIYSLGLCGAPAENDGRLEHRILRLLDWAEHIRSLGADTVLLNPVFDSDRHGYDTRDYFHLGPRLGTDDDLAQVCQAFHRAGLRVGETLTHINGHQIVDVLDYKFFSYDTRLELVLREEDGSTRTVRLRKREGEDLGLEFQTYLMDRARSCANNCIFCFVDQMPPGMRPSLYFKDDDARLSFLLGNYLTLTNMSDREVQRIIDLRISPINISVHTTHPELRAMMLKNKRAGRTIDIMRRFAEHHIIMNCQIVSCPGINDGPALDKTLNDLAEMFPSVNSVSVVPVGVTKFREGS